MFDHSSLLLPFALALDLLLLALAVGVSVVLAGIAVLGIVYLRTARQAFGTLWTRDWYPGFGITYRTWYVRMNTNFPDPDDPMRELTYAPARDVPFLIVLGMLFLCAGCVLLWLLWACMPLWPATDWFLAITA